MPLSVSVTQAYHKIHYKNAVNATILQYNDSYYSYSCFTVMILRFFYSTIHATKRKNSPKICSNMNNINNGLQ